MASLFVSYSSKDHKFVNKLVGDLRECGYSVVHDRSHFIAGKKLTPSILASIEGVDYFMVVVSPNALKSKWVRNVEISFAKKLSNGGHRICLLPILLGGKQSHPGLFPDRKYLDFRGSYQVAFAELIRTLPRLGYDEMTSLRNELYACSIQEKFRLLDLLEKAANTRTSWRGCTASDVMRALKKIKHDDDVVDEAYWWLIVKGVLQFLDTDTWWVGKDVWTKSVDFAEISPRGIAFLNDLILENG